MVAPGREFVVMLGAAATVIVSDLVAVTLSASVSVTVKVCVTAEPLRVPVIAPVPLAKLNPDGNVPVDTVQK